jgi:hypothetical protein
VKSPDEISSDLCLSRAILSWKYSFPSGGYVLYSCCIVGFSTHYKFPYPVEVLLSGPSLQAAEFGDKMKWNIFHHSLPESSAVSGLKMTQRYVTTLLTYGFLSSIHK